MPSLFDMNQINQPGMLQRGLLNPLTHLGLGLMSASAPRASYDPGGAMPNYGAGLLSGAQSYQQAQQAQAQQQYMQETMRARQQQAQAQAQQAQQEQEQAQQRQQAVQQYLLTLPPEQREQAGALLGMGVGGEKVMGLLNPDTEKWSDPYIDMSTGKPIMVQRNENTGALKSIGSGGVTVNNTIGGDRGLDARLPTREEAAQAGIPPGNIGDYVVEGGKLKLRPERGPSDADKRLGVLKGVEDSLNNYEALIDKHGTEYMPGPAKRQLEAARTDLLVELKNLYELGALQEPDMVLMRAILKDPTELGTNIGGLITLGKNKESYLAQLNVVRQKLAQSRQNLVGAPPAQTFGTGGAMPPLPPGFVPEQR